MYMTLEDKLDITNDILNSITDPEDQLEAFLDNGIEVDEIINLLFEVVG